MSFPTATHQPVAPNAPRMVAYLGCLIVCVGGFAGWLVLDGHDLQPFWVVASLAVLAALAERGGLRLTENVEVSAASLPTLFAAVAVGPLAAMVVSAASLLGDPRPPYMKIAVQSSTRAITGGLTGMAAAAASNAASTRLGSIAFATAVAVLVYELLDFAFAALTVQIRRSGSARAVLRALLPVLPASALLYVAVIAPLAFAYAELSPWAVLLFFVPALAAQQLYGMYQAQRRLAEDLTSANESLVRANLSFASALVTTLDARDRYTAGHSAAVAVYARDISAQMGLSTETQQLAHLSGLLHDIGKIGVPPGILEKSGPLTLHERRKMEEHSIIGERILANVEAYDEIARIVRHHHERIDSEGYPDRLGAEKIPLISRIICVADAYNAMTSERPYRDAMPSRVARDRLLQAAGSQFDPAVVAAFDNILEFASETYSSGARADFALEAQAHPELASEVEASAA